MQDKEQAGLVLIIEDNRNISEMVGEYLEGRGFEIDYAVDGIDGYRLASENTYDAIVLDLMLPRLDGVEVCKRLRSEARKATPILMLTARDTLDDKLRGYAEGADDYMVKPFAMRELDARLRALTRHAAPPMQALAVAGLHYDPQAMLASREGQRIPLTRLQGALLAALLRNHPNVSTHQSLLRAGWGNEGGDLPALQTQVYELRALVDRPFAHAMIQSVRGVGYRLVAPP